MEHQDHEEKQRGATCDVRLARLYIAHSVLLAIAIVWLVAILA